MEMIDKKISETCYVPQDLDSIQEAIDAANYGDRIFIGEGQFAGAIITKSVHIIGSGPKTVITEIPEPGQHYPKTGFYLEGPGANNSSISCLSFKPFNPYSYINNSVAFPVFCWFVKGVRISRISTERCVQGVTFTSCENCEVEHSNILGVTTGLGNGGAIGISIYGSGSRFRIARNHISLNEAFAPKELSPAGITVTAFPYGSSQEIVIRYNQIDVISSPRSGVIGIDISTDALLSAGNGHRDILVAFNDLRVEGHGKAILARPEDEVNAIDNFDGSMDTGGKQRRGVTLMKQVLGRSGVYY